MTKKPTSEFDNVTDEQLDKMIREIEHDTGQIRHDAWARHEDTGDDTFTPEEGYWLSDLEVRKDALLAEKKRRQQEKLAGHLEQLAELANKAGAEGVWVVRGAKVPTLMYSTEHSVTPVILDVEEAGVLVLIRFPVGDGREEGIESK